MQIDCSKLNCTSCCEKYWITILPEEAEAEADFLGISLKDFLEKHCILCLQLFPFPTADSVLSLPEKFFPKKIREKIEKETGAQCFLAMPSIAFRKPENKCVFLEKGLCKIYFIRPKQCELFPFISLNGETNFAEKYPFCKALSSAKFEESFLHESSRHYLKVSEHFNEIEKKGFERIWKSVPNKGIVLFKDKFLAKISKKEFFAILQKFGRTD